MKTTTTTHTEARAVTAPLTNPSPAVLVTTAGAHEAGQHGGATSAPVTADAEAIEVRGLRAIAAIARREDPTWRGGFVMIYKADVIGWARELPAASRYIPGVAAVPEAGPIRWTAGGTRDDAERWSDTLEPLPRILIKGDGGAIVAAIEQLCKSERGHKAAVAIRRMLEDGGSGLDNANFHAPYKISEALPRR